MSRGLTLDNEFTEIRIVKLVDCVLAGEKGKVNWLLIGFLYHHCDYILN
jgi:hypothetical protein